MNIVIDVGGTNIKWGVLNGNEVKLNYIKTSEIIDFMDLVQRIKAECSDIDGVALAACGHTINGTVDNANEKAKWLDGDCNAELKRLFGVGNTYVINDGDAHALALKKYGAVDYSAICFSLGTCVGVGMLDSKKNLVRALDGGNFEAGWMKPNESLRYYINIFRPKTLAISGGYVANNPEIAKEYEGFAMGNRIKFINLTEKWKEPALVGLSTLFDVKKSINRFANRKNLQNCIIAKIKTLN